MNELNVQDNRNSPEEASEHVLQCPRCKGVEFRKLIAYMGRKTIRWKDLMYEHGALLARCARCTIPVPNQGKYFTGSKPTKPLRKGHHTIGRELAVG